MKYDSLKARSHSVTTIATAINASNKLHYSLSGCSHDVAEWVEWISLNERVHTRNFFTLAVAPFECASVQMVDLVHHLSYTAVVRMIKYHTQQYVEVYNFTWYGEVSQYYVRNTLFTACVGVSLTVSNWLTQTKPDAVWCYDIYDRIYFLFNFNQNKFCWPHWFSCEAIDTPALDMGSHLSGYHIWYLFINIFIIP